MAEGGIIERLAGGGDEVEAESDIASGAADPIAAAVAIDAARFDPELSRKAAEYLDEQKRLARIQTEHLHEQRAVQLDHLKLRRLSERMRVTLQAFLLAVATLILLSVGGMVWSAAHDHGLVVEAFSVPPDLASRGLSGQVIAKQVLDRLANLQSQTVSSRASNTYKNNWGNDLKVEIPETGISVAELGRWLRTILGHQTHISGEVYRTSRGIAVTARVGEDGSTTLFGADADYDELIQQASEAIYRLTQPYRYAKYLDDHNCVSEARAQYARLIASSSSEEQAWGYMGLFYDAEKEANRQAAYQYIKLALAQHPTLPVALTNLTSAELDLGHDALAVSSAENALNHLSEINREIAAPQRGIDVAFQKLTIEYEHGDYVGVSTMIRGAPERDRQLDNLRDILAFSAALYHDPHVARQIEAERSTMTTPPDLVLGIASLQERAPASVVSLRRSFMAEANKDRDHALRDSGPFLAVAEARFGDLQEARHLASEMPLDCYDCIITRGVVASYASDPASAEQWFAKAIREAPTLPRAYLSRGQARFRVHNFDGAMADAKKAVRLGPHYADAHGLWGDVLGRRSQWRAAQAEYEEALRYAPAWTTAREAREEVARKN